MSSNLLKYHYTCVNQDEKRVIDSNELIAKKLEVLVARQEEPATSENGFTGGLEAQHLEGLFEENGAAGDNGESPNVIKGQPETSAYTGPDPEELLQEAREEIERMQLEAAKALEQERSRVLEEARRNGYQEGSRKAQEEYQAREQQLEQKARMLEQEYQRQIDELEPNFIDTLTGIYEHIFHVDLKDYREILVYLIHSTLRKAEGSRDFLIHVSVEDYPYVSMQKKQILMGAVAPGTSVEIIEDTVLGRNECMIETSAGIFDCGLETELTELTKKLKLLSYEKKETED